MRLAVQIAIVGAGALVLGYLAKRTADGIGSGISSAWSGVGTAASSIANGIANGVNYVAPKLNPASDQNIVYSGVNGVGSALTGDSNFTLGGWFYDLMNPSTPATASTPFVGPPTSTPGYLSGLDQYLAPEGRW